MTKGVKRAKSGFTLVEMLCTIVVLLLVTGLMTVGVRLAVKAYDKEVSHAESKELCATIRTLVNDELRYCNNVEVTEDSSGNTVISFFSQNYGENAEYTVDEEGQVLLGGNKILSAKSYSYNMRARVDISAYDKTTRIFDASVTVTDTDGAVLAESNFQVKQLNKNVES